MCDVAARLTAARTQHSGAGETRTTNCFPAVEASPSCVSHRIISTLPPNSQVLVGAAALFTVELDEVRRRRRSVTVDELEASQSVSPANLRAQIPNCIAEL